jgi:hypothetical protein
VTEGPARDVVMMALRWARDEFIANNPWPFLVGEPVMQQPRAAMKTLTNIPPALRKLETLSPDTPNPEPHHGIMGFVVTPLRKRQPVFPEMITLGRTANNDVVIPDATISKFHAYFRANESGAWELVDAGSRNGTKVMGRPLSAKVPVDVAVGARIRFGNIDLVLRDAGDTWDTIRRRG